MKTAAFILNPTFDQQQANPLDLIVAATEDAIAMVEAGASEVSEEVMLAAMDFAHEACKKLCALQNELAAKVGNVAKTGSAAASYANEEILGVVRERFSAHAPLGPAGPGQSIARSRSELAD